MSISIWDVLQFVLTAFEIGVCIWICDVVVYDGELLRKHKKYTMITTVTIIIYIAFNRTLSFFSWILFIVEVLLLVSFIAIKIKKNRGLMFLLVLDYCLLVELLDLSLCFFAVSYLDDRFWNILYYEFSNVSTLVYFISRLIVFSLIVLIIYYKRKYRFNVDNYKGVLFSIGTIGCIWGWWLLVILEDYNSEKGLRDSLFIITCLIILLTLMSIELKNAHLKTQAQIVSIKNELLQQSYSNLHNLYKNNQYAYHDFKNHIVILRNYLEQKRCEEAALYIQKISQPIEKLNSYIRSGCDILDLVLNIKEVEAEQKRISYKVDIDKDIQFQMNKNELGNMLFNLLDNAIEACEKIEHRDKWIHITIKRKNQIQIIKIENSIEKPIYMKNGEYVTGKKDREFHGIGMKSVEASVSQYGGNVWWSHTDTVFTAIITFFENEL